MRMSSPAGSSVAAARVPAWRQWMRRLYLLAAALVGACIVVQVFFAGAAVLVNPAYWATHRAFGNMIDMAVLALPLLGLATGLPWRLQALGALLYPLMFLQYLFLYLMPQIGVPLLRALHAVNALVLFLVALSVTFKVWRYPRA